MSHQCPSQQSILLPQRPIHEIFLNLHASVIVQSALHMGHVFPFFSHVVRQFLQNSSWPQSRGYASSHSFLEHIQHSRLSLLTSLLWHFRLWSFLDRDTRLERFLAKNQLYSNEITRFWVSICWQFVKKCQFWTFKVNFLCQKSSESL